jgi:predicted phosphodiesterase
MRILIISDIHANLEALEAVIEAAGEVDACWCLGDVVGYGPNPNECVELVQQLPELVYLMGNHDAAAIGVGETASFNPEARLSVEWQQKHINDSTREFLHAGKERQQVGNYTLVHGSPRQPLMEYLLDTETAARSFSHFQGDFCLMGHTHIPVIFKQSPILERVTLSIPNADSISQLQARSMINPGSVGQPRDRDPRAAYAILDDERDQWNFHRVEYPVSKVQEKMKVAGLPERHITRLESGW